VYESEPYFNTREMAMTNGRDPGGFVGALFGALMACHFCIRRRC
jgi:hypothetical protein